MENTTKKAPASHSTTTTARPAAFPKAQLTADATDTSWYTTYYHELVCSALKQTIPSEPVALPPAALGRDANKRFPILTIPQAPFPFVNPAVVMPPTLEEAQLGNSYTRTTPVMPVVTVNGLTAALPELLRAKAGPRPPVYSAPAAEVTPPPSATAPSAATATTGVETMGPPPRPAQKRKRVEEVNDMKQAHVDAKKGRSYK